MPVGTAGTEGRAYQRPKGGYQAQIILGNTYHLFLRPGTSILKDAGGLRKFNGWDRPILTDSGGYQVYSLANQRKITEEGATFASHIDGAKHLFTPERVMDIQREIGADIIMAFDECPPIQALTSTPKSPYMTHRWLDRCFDQLDKVEPLYGYSQALFPIIQGSTTRTSEMNRPNISQAKMRTAMPLGPQCWRTTWRNVQTRCRGMCHLAKDKLITLWEWGRLPTFRKH